ncbi:hypothetical protein Ssi02_72900 [Sinosporangium siamense]|uniref:Uncharacterized protein n=1 Tax=Sinosporangium siamense TaxID=1367973 RepID=A0A919RRR5_9ACTN|nr:hypothetical protein Ssi02_72900 [Sinosporangium siamense]
MRVRVAREPCVQEFDDHLLPALALGAVDGALSPLPQQAQQAVTAYGSGISLAKWL